MGHRAASRLALGKLFLDFEDFGSLEVAEFGGDALQSAGEDCHGGQEVGEPIAVDDLGAHWVGGQAERLADLGLH